MSTQASFDVTGGNAIAASWGDNVGAHLLTTETATPSTLFEGKQWVRTDQDRIYTRNGSSANIPTGWYSSTGRIGCSGTMNVSGIGSASDVKLQFTASTDPAGIYTGWNGTDYIFTLPEAGLWLFCVFLQATSAPGGTSWYLRLMSSGSEILRANGNGNIGHFGTLSFMLPVSASANVAVRCSQNSGSSVDIGSSSVQFYRLGA